MSPKSLARMIATKERLRQVRRADLAVANASVTAAEQLLEERTGHHRLAAATVARTGEQTGETLALSAEHVSRERTRVMLASRGLEGKRGERDEQRDALTNATQEVRTLETLQKRMRVDQLRGERLREQGELDEVASRKKPGQVRR
jgi:hypothetical protein